MTLYRQLMSVLIIVFAIVYIGTVSISVNHNRDYLNNQLQSLAQDTATMLGLSISSYSEDRATVDSMIKALFDSGDYRLIRFDDMERNPIIEHEVPIVIDRVPGWFIRLLTLEAPVAESLVMNGWSQVGKITVATHPGYAYQQAWRNFVGTFTWFLVCTVCLALVTVWLLKRLLKPLKAVEKQAQSIIGKNFIIQDEMPPTRELRSVVTVMNQLSKKVGKMFQEQSEKAESYREQLFSHSLTGLPNRRYFDAQLQHLIETPEEFDSGALFFIALSRLREINQHCGYNVGDQVLNKTAEILQKQAGTVANSVVSHFSGSEFAILINGITEKESDRYAKRFADALEELHALGVDESYSEIHVGVACYRPSQPKSEFYASADLALRKSQSNGRSGWYRYESETDSDALALGTQNWKDFLRNAIENELFELHFQQVLLIDESLAHYEVLARVAGPQGNLIAASVFMPMVERAGLSARLDRITIIAWIAFMANIRDAGRHFAINISPHSIQDPEFVDWLLRLLNDHPDLAARLIIELPEYGICCQLKNVQILIDKLTALRCRFAIDHFGRSFASFGYLKSIKVEYLKLDGSLIRGIGENVENQFYVESLIKSAHEIEIPVFAEYVETEQDRLAVTSLGVDGFQGFLFGKPEKFAG